jgi:hypothetical protein
MGAVALGLTAAVLIAIAILAPCVEAYSQRTWPRATLVPSGVAMLVAILLLAITN